MAAIIKNTEDIQQLGTIMGVWAHPDDETYSMAGIMAAAIQNGQKVICITATRGEAGVQDEARWPAHKLADIRTKELQAAFKEIGAIEHIWLDYADGGCKDVPLEDAVKKIAALISKYEPTSIFSFGPEGMTGHDDHKMVSVWATAAAHVAKSRAAIYYATQTTEQFESMIEADEALNVFFNIEKPPVCNDCDCDICFTLSDELFAIKLRALKAMPSQTESMLQKFSHVLPRAVGVEAFRRYRP